MRKLLIALIAGAFAAVTFGALAADEKPYTAQPGAAKPGRAADDTAKNVKSGGDITKPGRAADETAPPKKSKKKKKSTDAPPK